MKRHRFINEASLDPLYDGIEQFCAEYLPCSTPRVSSHKIIADPVEGYSSLDSWEMSVVDTPMFQRLRGIRQLGLAYLVYPTLGYSRFEHVIGIRARFEQLIAILRDNELLRGQGTVILPTEKQQIRMRLALLCHDLGHCLFSHVSESVIEQLPGHANYPSSASVMSLFHQLAGRKLPMAEILSVLIITSQPFIDYLHAIGIPDAGRHEGADKIAFDAAHLVLGLPLPRDPSSLFLAQLMNSGLDVDKLDYMFRESLLSGISLGISLQWLMKKLMISYLSGDHVPNGLRSRLGGFTKDQQFAVLSLQRGGQFAFEEFCVARLTLHEKIYLHQKIRAAEAQVRAGLFRLGHEVSGYNEIHRWLYLKESLADHPDATLPCLPTMDLFNREHPRTIAPFNLHGVCNRLLLSRSFAFGWQNSIADPLRHDAKDHGVDRLMETARTDHLKYLSAIRERLSMILSLLSVEDVNVDSLTILIDPPKLSTIQQGQDSVYIEYPSRLSLRWTMPIDRIEDYYHRNRALGYVFTENHALPFVLLAAERAAWDLCGVVCVQEGFVNKDVVAQSCELRISLDRRGFYDDAAPLRPISDFLAGVEAQMIVTTVAERLAPYESRTKKRVSPASVTTFVSQFPADLQPAALSWLQNIRFIRPDTELCTLISRLAKERLSPAWKSLGISPLGATTDSAYHIAYDLREPLSESLPKTVRAPQVPLAEALGMSLDCYLIFDDNTNSGLQALNIVAAWLGKDLPDKLQLKEDHVQSLPKELAKELLGKPTCFAFALATEGAPERLQSLLVEHLGFSRSLLQCHASVVLEHKHKLFSGTDAAFQHVDKVRLRDFLVDVAKTIFIEEGKTPEVAEARSLGDNRAEAMTVFPYNCPTMTIPAIWLAGKYGRAQWVPLVERGRRMNPLTGDLSGEDA